MGTFVEKEMVSNCVDGAQSAQLMPGIMLYEADRVCEKHIPHVANKSVAMFTVLDHFPLQILLGKSTSLHQQQYKVTSQIQNTWVLNPDGRNLEYRFCIIKANGL